VRILVRRLAVPEERGLRIVVDRLRLQDSEYAGWCDGHTYWVRVTGVSRSIGDVTGEMSAEVAFEFPTGQMKGATGFEVPGAMLPYSVIDIGFDAEFGSAPTEQGLTNVRVWSFRFLNRFLNVYRVLLRDVEVLPLTSREFHEVRAGQPLVVRTVETIGGEPVMSTTVHSDMTSPIRTPLPMLDESDHQSFRERLSGEEDPPLTLVLMLNARGAIARGARRIAVIEMNVALDICVKRKAVEVGSCRQSAGPRTEGG